VRIELEAICNNPRGVAQERHGTHARSVSKRLLPFAITAVAAAGATFAVMWTTRVQPAVPRREAGLRRFSMAFGEVRPVVSPDGHHVAYRADDRLWVRDLDSETPREIPGGKGSGGYYTDVGYYLTWSPDSQSIVFPAGNELRRVSILQGGSATTVCTLPDGRTSGRQIGGLAWSGDGETIVFSRYQGGVYEVAARGGSPTLLWKEDHADDVFLVDTPQGHAIVYAVITPEPGHAIMVHRPDGQQEKIAQIDANWPELQYSPTGHILFRKNPIENPSIWALPFSATTLRAGGAPFLVERSGQGMSLAQDGTFVYLDTGRIARQFLAWRDLGGRILGQAREGHEIIDFVRLSPVGNQAVVTATENGRSEVWIYDLDRFNRIRFDLGPDANDRTVLATIWPRPGRDLLYSLRSNVADNGTEIFAKPADGVGPAQRVAFPKGFTVAQDRTSDGRHLFAAYSSRPGEASRIWFLQNDGDGTDGHAVNFSQNSETETALALSPNNRYVAYTSTIGGGLDVYVRPFPTGPGRWQVSTAGGAAPRWKSDGTQLFFAEGNTLMRVDVTTGGRFATTSPPVRVFEHPALRGVPAPFARYDVAPDGRRFLTVESQRELDRPVVRVVENWHPALREPQPAQ
jgi:Tol biopolymer transport system component